MLLGRPLVSVIAVCFNHERWVINTLESIINQTYKEIELIIIDDASSDSSQYLIVNYVRGKKSVEIILHNTNMGICFTLNEGIRLAKGKYIQVIACDDELLPDKIEMQVAEFEDALQLDDSIGVLYSDAYLMNEEGVYGNARFIQRARLFYEIPEKNIHDRLLKGNFIPAPSALIRKYVFDDMGGYDENLYFEDYEFWLRVSKKYSFIYSDKIKTKYRVLSDSMSHNNRNWNFQLTILKVLLEEYKSNPTHLELGQHLQDTVAILFSLDGKKFRKSVIPMLDKANFKSTSVILAAKLHIPAGIYNKIKAIIK